MVPTGSVEDVPIAEARRQFEVNVFGLARLIQLAVPRMRAQGSGRIINVSSIGGKIYEPLKAIARQNMLKNFAETAYASQARSVARRVESADNPRTASGPDVIARKIVTAAAANSRPLARLNSLLRPACP